MWRILPCVLQLDQGADRLLERHLRVGPVELVQRDLLQAQPAQAALAGRAEVLGPAVGRPPPGPGAFEAALGGDDQVVGIRVQRLGDQRLADVGTVGVGGVDEVDAELDRPAQHRLGLVAVRRLTPDAVTGDPHRAEAETVHGEVAADVDGAGGGGGGFSHL